MQGDVAEYAFAGFFGTPPPGATMFCLPLGNESIRMHQRTNGGRSFPISSELDLTSSAVRGGELVVRITSAEQGIALVMAYGLVAS